MMRDTCGTSSPRAHTSVEMSTRLRKEKEFQAVTSVTQVSGWRGASWLHPGFRLSSRPQALGWGRCIGLHAQSTVCLSSSPPPHHDK